MIESDPLLVVFSLVSAFFEPIKRPKIFLPISAHIISNPQQHLTNFGFVKFVQLPKILIRLLR